MYYYGGYSGGYNNSCGCGGNYPNYGGCGCGGYGGGGYGNGYGAAIILVLFILLVIIIGSRITV